MSVVSGHPRGLAVLFLTEMWERFGYYTMLAIMTLYLDEHFHVRNPGKIYGTFTALVYFAPIVGGYVSDRFLGLKRTIAMGAVLLAAGYGLLSVPIREAPGVEQRVSLAEQAFRGAHEQWQSGLDALKTRGGISESKRPVYSGPERTAGQGLFLAALLLIIAGNGLFKPNVSVLVGALYPPGSPLKDAGFNIFYLGVNIGAFFAPITAATLRASLGWSWAFGAAAVGMTIGLVTFCAASRLVIPLSSPVADTAVEEVPRSSFARQRLLTLPVVLSIVILFTMAFQQNGFTLTLWARDSTGPLMGGWKIPAESFAAANALFVMLFTPVVIWLWSRTRQQGVEPTPLGKMSIGMFFAMVAFCTMGVAGLAGGDTGLVSPLWLIAGYAFVTAGELCVSPMGLAFCFEVAPLRFRGLVMGCWFGAIAVGNYLSGAVEPLWQRWPHSLFFLFLAGTCGFAGLLVRWAARWIGEPLVDRRQPCP